MICLRCWRVRNQGISGMRSDSFEWTCSKLGVRTYQRLTETLGFPAGAKLKKKRPPQLLLQAQDNNKAIRTEHVVVAISLGGRHDPRRQSDLAAALAAVAAPPLGPT